MLNIRSMSVKTLGLHGLSVETEDNAAEAINTTSTALKLVSENRSRIGAQQNRLEHTIRNEQNILENTTASESKIRDADMASEMVRFSIQNILMQSGNSMLSQANASKQGVLNLLQ